MATSFYDVVVIGDELAGAVAAAHLARRGFRTLVVCSAPTERDVVGELSLPRSPLVLTGIEAPALRRLSGELHLLQLVRRRAEPLSPAFQVLLPDHRLDVSNEDLAREMARELPEEASLLEAWSARAADLSARIEPLVVEDVTLPPDGFWDRRDLKRIAAQLPGDDEEPPLGPASRLIADLPGRFGADLARPGFIARARLADLLRRGAFRLDGGREALRALVLDRIKTYSGEVRFGAPVRAVQVRRGRVTGVVVGARDEIVGCTHVIAAMPAAQAIAFLDEAPPRRLAEAAAVPLTHQRYHLHFVAPLEALPDAIARFAFSVRDPSRPLEDDNALALHVSSAGGGRHAVLSVEALARDPSPAGLARLRAAIHGHVSQLIPFLDRHLRAVWSPHDGLPPDLIDVPASALPPARAMAGQIALPPPRPIGVCGLPHATGIRQLLLASREVLPGLGLEGELVTGWGAARLIATRDKKRVLDKGELFGT